MRLLPISLAAKRRPRHYARASCSILGCLAASLYGKKSCLSSFRLGQRNHLSLGYWQQPLQNNHRHRPAVAKKAEERQQAPKPGIKIGAAQVKQDSGPPRWRAARGNINEGLLITRLFLKLNFDNLSIIKHKIDQMSTVNHLAVQSIQPAFLKIPACHLWLPCKQSMCPFDPEREIENVNQVMACYSRE